MSTPNANIAGFTGSVGAYDFTLGADGLFALPLSSGWGLQADGIASFTGEENYYGGAAHLFTRDPKQGFIGAYVSDVGWGLSDYDQYWAPSAMQTIGQAGGEAGIYLGRFTVRGAAAYQFGTDTGAAALAKVAFYARDDLKVEGGLSYIQGLGNGYNADVEWSPTGGPSFFAEAAANSQSGSVLVGVKAYFGDLGKSLIRREREDYLPDDLYTIVGNGFCPLGAHEMNGFCDGNS